MRKIFTVKHFSYIILFSVIFSSCVSTKEHNALKQKCNEENTQLKRENQNLSVINNEKSAEIEKLKKQLNSVKNEIDILNDSLQRLAGKYSRLNKNYTLLIENNKKLLVGNEQEIQQILNELQITREDLQKREDTLTILEEELILKKQDLEDLSMELNEKEIKLQQLQDILNKKDSIVSALKQKVSDALFGFEDKGLTIDIRNGKVYVSLEENLLFRSGSYTVGEKGKEALLKLAVVLEENPDINVLIEGHTDDVPYKGSGQIKDNWDLSVMRATAIVKILVWNSDINPERLIAAGRSKYVPVDTAKTKEARSKNRRTEIILTPQLDELFRIIDAN
ncbi:MAG: OmpA family protein [Bacteroidales bacterium]|nr:OmpA family protein [Bacteroidales bacterium]